MNQRLKVTDNETRMLDISALCAYINIGKTRAAEWGESVGAKRKFGKRVLYDKKVIDKALDRMA